MDLRTNESIGSWRPRTKEWGNPAYEETKLRFVDLVLGASEPRAQAFALWALSHDPTLEGEALLEFGGNRGGERPSPEQIRRAASAVGIAPAPASASEHRKVTEVSHMSEMSKVSEVSQMSQTSETSQKPGRPKGTKKPGAAKGKRQLSNLEKAILANFKDANQLLAAYRKAEAAVEKARKNLEKAADELRSIDKDKAKVLAQLEPGAESLLKTLGVLGKGGPSDDWAI